MNTTAINPFHTLLNSQKPLIRLLLWAVPYFAINLIFIAKYAPLAIHTWALVGYPFLIITAYVIVTQFPLLQSARNRICLFFILIVLTCALQLLILNKVNPFDTTVDRWSALHFWSEALLKGEYPYLAHTHRGGYGSPFPIWQLWHLPFYLLGDVGYAQLASFLVLVTLLYKNRHQIDSLLFIILLIASPAYWWEVLVRSDLLSNLILAFCLIFYLEKHLEKWKSKPIVIGIIIGLATCTRLLAGIPLLIGLFRNYLPNKLQSSLLAGLFFSLGLGLPFIPFALWDSKNLFHSAFSPIVLQTRQGTWVQAIFGVLLIGIMAMLLKDKRSYYWAVSIFLFAFISYSAFPIWKQIGIEPLLMKDKFDISYFNTCLPFLLAGFCLKSGTSEHSLS